MKILHAIGGIWEHTGGPAESVPYLCRALVAAGHEVGIATLEGPLSPAAHECRAAGVTISTWPWRTSLYTPAFARGFGPLCAAADVVHSHALWRHVNWTAGRTARRLGKPHVIALRGCLEPARLAHHRSLKRLSGWVFDDPNLRAAACIHATAPSEYESARAYGLTNPVAIIRNGVDVSALSQPVDPERLYARFPELRGRRVLLYLSRLSWEKGMPLLAEAWAAVAKAAPDWHLLVVGSGEPAYERELHERFAALGLSDRTTWAGRLLGDDKLAALGVSELFILPTLNENFGIVVAEALATGVPVITTYGAPWAELLTADCGWWTPITADAITGALNTALALPPATLRAMGERGRALIHKHYTWGPIAADMTAVYRWLLDGGAAPACVQQD